MTSQSQRSWLALVDKYAVIWLAVISLLVGLSIFIDYGVSWDERESWKVGRISYEYVFNGDDRLETFYNRDYGAGFELPLVIIERLIGIEDHRSIILLRHLVTHMFFLLGALCLFVLIRKLSSNKILPYVGFIMLVVNPRIYAHSFFNSKDIPFLAMLIVCYLLLFLAFQKKSSWRFLVLGMASGYLCSLRVVGVLMAGIVLGFLLIDYFHRFKNGQDSWNSVPYRFSFAAPFILGFIFCILLTWPALWSDPLGNFIDAIQNMSAFNRGPATTLFAGTFYRGYEIPKTYFPVWFSITNPLPFLLVGILGIGMLFSSIVRNPLIFFSNTRERNFIAFAAFFFTPVLAAIILDSPLYDGWRHLFFVYPSFILMGLFGFGMILDKCTLSIQKRLAQAGLVVTTWFLIVMIIYHPTQQVFFNYLANYDRNNLRYQFDMDYWGTSYYQGLQAILRLEEGSLDKIKIKIANAPGRLNTLMLPPKLRKRTIARVEMDDPDYFMSNYRWHPENYPYTEKIYSRTFRDNEYFAVWKLK